MVTYEKWKYKSNPSYPTVEKVREEITQTVKGMLCASVCPALAVYMVTTGAFGGISKAYCGNWGNQSVGEHLLTAAVIWAGSDFYEFFYHRLGHVNFTFWQQHKHHHVFHNPSPFSVIADEWVDQFFRSMPLLVIPLLIPTNIDMLFFIYATFFYFYGVYLHSGHELPGLSAHNPVLNTSFQHYCHHAKSLMNKPYHCGFFVKIWDRLFDCQYPNYDPETCICAGCCRERGERTREAYEKVVKPDYSSLFSIGIWMDALLPGSQEKEVKSH